MGLMKDKNIKNTFNSYKNKFSSELKNISGVNTGKLRNSIISGGEPYKIVIKFIDYGKYINPWVKKTGSKNKPGYIDVLNKLENEYIKDFINSFQKDIGNSIPLKINIII